MDAIYRSIRLFDPNGGLVAQSGDMDVSTEQVSVATPRIRLEASKTDPVLLFEAPVVLPKPPYDTSVMNFPSWA